MLKIIVDENIPFAQEAFNQFGRVTLLPGKKIMNHELLDADILIVRSVTKVNELLLKNTSVKFVGTATIGTDHIDIEYLKKNNIAFSDARGCNAYSVAEYIVASLLYLADKFDFRLSDKSLGVVGVGNIGSKVAVFAQALGMKVLLNDPPLKRKGDKRNFVELDEILNCDIITLHTPLNLTGADKTYHLFNKKNLNRLKDEAILINSSRGAVVSNINLLDAINNKNLKVVLDVWENEPDINIELLKKVVIATPHIAGYSYEGKVNGTRMIYESLCNFLGVEQTFLFNLPEPQTPLRHFDKSKKIEISLHSLISGIYSIKENNDKTKRLIMMNQSERILEFDLLRKNYPQRREFNNYTVYAEDLGIKESNLLKTLRFNLK